MIGLEIDLKKMLSAGRVITITAAGFPENLRLVNASSWKIGTRMLCL